MIKHLWQLRGQSWKHLSLSEEQLRQLEDTFNSYLVKKCSDSQMIIVTLPLAVTDRFNVSEIFFQEQHCKGTKNQTHWILKTQR